MTLSHVRQARHSATWRKATPVKAFDGGKHREVSARAELIGKQAIATLRRVLLARASTRSARCHFAAPARVERSWSALSPLTGARDQDATAKPSVAVGMVRISPSSFSFFFVDEIGERSARSTTADSNWWPRGSAKRR